MKNGDFMEKNPNNNSAPLANKIQMPAQGKNARAASRGLAGVRDTLAIHEEHSSLESHQEHSRHILAILISQVGLFLKKLIQSRSNPPISHSQSAAKIKKKQDQI
jgi:hypothetical protein